jgi:hypothetical protein
MSLFIVKRTVAALSIAGTIVASAWCWQHKEVMLVVEAATALIK